MIAAHGPDPRLSAIGFTFPPFLIYLTMLVMSPISTQVLLGTSLIALVIWLVNQLQCGRVWRGIILILLLINPAFLMMLMTSPTWTAIGLFLGLSVLLYWHLFNPRDQKYPLSVNLVLLGLTLAPLPLLRYEFWFLVPIFMILNWFCIDGFGDKLQLKFTTVLVTSFMSIVSILGFLYINWLISDDPFYFLYAPGNGLRWPSMEHLLESAEGFQAVWLSFAWLGKALPVYYVLIILAMYKIRNFWVARGLLIGLPISLLILFFWQNNFLPQLAIFGAFSILVPVTLLQIPQLKSQYLWLLAVSLIFGLTITINLLNLNRFTPEESLVWRKITRQAMPKNIAVSQWRQRQLDTQEISNFLFQRLRPGQKILLDDAVNFSLIYLLQNSQMFILPHQYEFSVALSRPEEIVDYILIRREPGIQPLADQALNVGTNQTMLDSAPTNPRHNFNILTQQFPNNVSLNNFEVVVSNTFYQLFQRN